MKRNNNLFFLIIILLFIWGCNNKTIFESNKDIPSSIWKIENKLKFEVNVKDINPQYKSIIYLKNNQIYKYSNLFLFVKFISPDSIIKKDTFEFIIADRKGKWLGKGVSNEKTNSFDLSHKFNFSKIGKYTIEIEQGMREKNLEGIVNVGIKIERN